MKSADRSTQSRKKTVSSKKTQPNQVKPTTKRTEKLTLYDRLSHLSYKQACDILGPEGALMLRRPQYSIETIDIESDVYLGDDLFRLSINESWSEPATVTIMLEERVKHKLNVCCSVCNPTKAPNQFCEHVVATLSFLLEEKALVGLAEIPDLDTPMELLSPKKLQQRALHERKERARNEKFKVKSSDPKMPWTDYYVASELSGKTYRVALRGPEFGDSYCSCPDFKTNRLGTCKHILHLLDRVKRKFDEATRKVPPVNLECIVYLRYGETRTLHLELDADTLRCDCESCIKAHEIARPFLKGPITNIPRLLKIIEELETLDCPVTIYPDAEEWIQQQLFQNRIKELVQEIRKDPKKHPLRKSLLAVELLPYQLDGIAFAVGAGRAVLADDMGLGKTIQGIGVAELLAQVAEIKKVLIVCPASVKSQWKAEIARFAPHRNCQVVLGNANERFEQYGNNVFFTVCNYEQVIRDLLPIEQTKWDLIILDEGQRIKNWEAKTSRAIKSLRSTFALVLSGTPMENRIDELYSVVQFIDDRHLLPAYRFFHRHRIVEDTGRVAGFKNLDLLREELKPILLRRTKESVRLELPDRITEVVRIAPTGEQLEMHNGFMQIVAGIVAKPYLTEMDLLRLRKALLGARMSADSSFLVNKTEPMYSSKMDRLEELLVELLNEPDRKIVLFSEWTTMLNLIERICKPLKVDYVRLDGKVPQRQRQQLIHQFNNNPECRLFLMTNAGSVGLNLQSANTLINVDLPWNPAILEQRIGRIHRMGQKRQVQVFLLVTEETIEAQMLTTLSAKHELALASLDINSETSEVMLQSGVEELKRRLEILLGSKPAAPVDRSQQKETLEPLSTQQQGGQNTQNTQKIQRQKQELSEAGSNALSAFIELAGTLIKSIPTQTGNNPILPILEKNMPEFQGKAAKLIEESVHIEADESGKTKLSFTLPEKPALEGFIQGTVNFLQQLIK